MKFQIPVSLFALTLTVVFSSCATEPPSRKIPVSTDLGRGAKIDARLHREVNAYRNSQNATQLQRHSGLDRLALEHSEYLRKHRGSFSISGKNVSHIGFESRALMARHQYGMSNVSENVAAGNNPRADQSQMIFNLWKNSKDHRINMLDQWTHTGLGVVVDSDGTVFATQLFSTASSSRMTMRERFNQF